MDIFLENAHRIFDVARCGTDAENQDFALLIREDGGLHFVMETPFSIEAAALECGARAAYRVTRSRGGVRVAGQSGGKNCTLEERNTSRAFVKQMLPDRTLYRMTSPLLTS
jgi:hypothetical protein